ncbi:SDR family oxidoreductase [Staphylococcus saccharolyticus]|uniref:SDR family oxidoreductase n=1 Tax=Staphylococcus saccharolyticus TaxID=33028 RepID=UPI00102DE871|nr:SDR family oxidoreductase [Staphylococcus saccharolyticus]MBL7573711.1 SDR family oxidoreductase [Staphylococcus saccharolyticus]MBL7584499.1 SDR family oxidoreductase [Staphylococcus saccharolyticus]MBL7639361.1 SDR family oxidoreductase [Staphylococcus saccharolyticus]QRJ68681.1 SDR family oxidoreductase [Staphylococcus saccharolyticus]TAA92000.1 short chain dehydrogenase [Staphylococcus saccharolyticus]
MKRLENKISVVTGASTGIGQGSAKVLAKEGAHVLALDISDELEKTVQSIIDGGGKATAYKVDISDHQQVQDFAEEVKKTYGRVDVIFNNAGVNNGAGRIHEYSVEVFDKIMAVDMRGTFLVTKFLLPLMMDNGGSIINTALFSGQAIDLYRSGYNAAKGGVINFTKSIAIEYGRENIRANAIVPGTIETPLVDNLAGTSEDEAGKTFRENQKWVTPLGRLGTPDEVGKLVSFLASDDSLFITGETIRIDGGVMAYTWPGEVLSDDRWKHSTK